VRLGPQPPAEGPGAHSSDDGWIPNYIIWSFLNVLFPSALPPVSYFISKICRPNADVDELLAMSFDSGELFVVSLILVVVMTYELWEHRSQKWKRGITTLLNVGYFLGAFVLTVAFVCMRFAKHQEPPNPIMLHYFVLCGFATLTFTCTLSLVVKLALMRALVDRGEGS
jgi:hypothetical protein